MIERTGNATVAYLDNGFAPADRQSAEMVKVLYDDGRVVFGVPLATKRDDADAIVEKLAPHFSQLTLALDTVAGRIAKVEEKASETAVAMQGVCYEQDATARRLEGIESGSMVAATASAAAAKMAGVEPLTKEAWTDVVTDALARQAPPPKGIEKGDVQEAVTAAIRPLAQAMVEQARAIEYASRPRVKKARKLEDGSVEIVES